MIIRILILKNTRKYITQRNVSFHIYTLQSKINKTFIPFSNLIKYVEFCLMNIIAESNAN